MESPRTRTVLTGIIGMLFLPCIYTSQEIDMEDYCGKELSMILRSEYQLELELTDKYIYNRKSSWLKTGMGTCDVTVEAWYTTYRKLMFYFDDLDLDCDDGHLEFYYDQNSETRVTGLGKNICGDKKPKGVFTVDSRYLRIIYVPSRSQYIKDIFSIVITAYSDDTCPSYSHKCDNSRCINKDIVCNGYDSCGDGSGCHNDVTGIIIGASLGGLAVLAFIVCVAVCCICFKRKAGKPQGSYQSPVPTVAYTNSRQRQGYNQPVYGVDHVGPYPTNQVYPVASTGVLPTAPTGSGHQFNYQEPAPIISYGQLPISPPPYSELFGQSDNKASPHSDKQDHTYTKLDSDSALPTYDNFKQDS